MDDNVSDPEECWERKAAQKTTRPLTEKATIMLFQCCLEIIWACRWFVVAVAPVPVWLFVMGEDHTQNVASCSPALFAARISREYFINMCKVDGLESVVVAVVRRCRCCIVVLLPLCLYYSEYIDNQCEQESRIRLHKTLFHYFPQERNNVLPCSNRKSFLFPCHYCCSVYCSDRISM